MHLGSPARVVLSAVASVTRQATEIREKEKAENTVTIADSQDAQTAVAQAVTVLKESPGARAFVSRFQSFSLPCAFVCLVWFHERSTLVLRFYEKAAEATSLIQEEPEIFVYDGPVRHLATLGARLIENSTTPRGRTERRLFFGCSSEQNTGLCKVGVWAAK